MNHPDIARTIATGHPHGEPVTVDECTYCGQELSEGEEVLAFPSQYNYFCNAECVTEQMLKEGNIEWRVLE